MDRNQIAEATVEDNPQALALSGDLRNLDVLRAFAVLAVAGAHTFRYSSKLPMPDFVHNFGVGGVLFFFVHTSLVLLLSMQRTKSDNLTLSFYIRRAFRIYPLCWTCIILVLATGLTDVAHETIVQMGWRGILVNVLLVQNIIRYSNIEMPLWSLPWEVQMYILLPAVFFLMKKYARPWLPLVLWCGATGMAVACTALPVPRVFQAAVFPPMFIGGMIAYRLLGQVRARFPSYLWPAAILILMLVRCVFMRGILINTPRNAAVNATTCLVLGLGIPLFHEVRAHWLRSSAHQLAKYSYGIYLLHIPSLELVFHHLPVFPLVVRIAIFIVITGTASVLTFHLIENPLIDVGRSLGKKMG